ncbi:MAG: aminopeptidase P family protein [Bacteroidales bacterium]|nr:aminopeptidase P family protein [Bacteroidales bacterium]
MFPKRVYSTRRALLAKDIESGIILIPGNSEAPSNYPGNCYKFRQDSTFLYFFGLNDPDFAGVIDADKGEEILFGNDVSIDDIIWMGPQTPVAKKADSVGVKKTKKISDLAKYLAAAIKAGRKIHYIAPYRYQTKILLSELLGIPIGALQKNSSEKLIKAVVSQRIIKDKYEIEEIDKACNIGYAMHLFVMQNCKVGVPEQQLAGMMDGIAMSQGAGVSFATILSQHGETLHNHDHSGIITKGKLLTVDAGAENNNNYCSDFTRTMPCSGKFTTKQKEIYQIVCDANNLALELAKPGVAYFDVHVAVYRLFAERLKALGLMKGDVDEAVEAGAPALFMPHGLGHNMGLDVHDMENYGEDYVGYGSAAKRSKKFGYRSLRMARKLVPGNVITDEPGIYFIPALIEKWKKEKTCAQFINFSKLKEYYDFGGIRLEDDVLITPTGNRLLGAKRLPITVKEVEAAMRG